MFIYRKNKMKQNNIIEIGFIPPKRIEEVNKRNIDTLIFYVVDIDRIIEETFELIKTAGKSYNKKEFSSDALMNFYNYVYMLQNHLLDCRDKINLVLHDLAKELQKELEENENEKS